MSKVQNLGFLGFLFCGQIISYKSYLISYFNRDLCVVLYFTKKCSKREWIVYRMFFNSLVEILCPV